MNNVTVVIPSYNTSTYIKDCLKIFLKSTCINEIIIGDDFSRVSELEKLEEIVFELKKETKKEIILIKNNKNKGAFENKKNLVQESTNQLVYVFDADNIPQKNIDQTIEKILSNAQDNFIYVPSKIYQFESYYIISKLLSIFNSKYRVRLSKKDMLIDIEMVRDYILNDTDYTIDKNLMWVLSVGNYFVNKKGFNKHVAEEYEKFSSINVSNDFLAVCYFHLTSGGKIKLIENFYHFHRKRKDSAAFLLGDEFFESIQIFKKKFMD